MTASVRIALAQIDPVVGAFDANIAKIVESYERACREQARLLLTPELSLCGYPPHDLIERPEMIERTEKALEKIAKATVGKKTAIAVGHVSPNKKSEGRAVYNSVTIFDGGKAVFSQAKTLLPTYDVFDEARYFEPAEKTALWDCDGVPIAVAICEDLWANDPAFGRALYGGRNPVDEYARLGAKILVSLSASPFEQGKRARREELHGEIAARLKCPLLYVNQVGANDDLLFDGGSFVRGAKGEFIGRLPVFKPGFACFDVSAGSCQFVATEGAVLENQVPDELAVLARGLIRGIRDYFQRTGFSKAVLGLSGGIDSAVVAVLAAQALGPENVIGIAMPSQYSSSHSLADAETLARGLGIKFEVKPIKFLFSTASRELNEGRGTLAPIALENLQARLRGVTLMTLSNHENALVLATSNKSELAVGYSTLYGDLCGAIAPIGDVYKTQVYALAKYLNQALSGVIPENTMTKPPSAELKPGQVDQDSLPPYSDLDAFLEAYFEHPKEESRDGSKSRPKWASEILTKIERSEFKRRQAPPVLKVSAKAFGVGRKIPVAKHWDA